MNGQSFVPKVAFNLVTYKRKHSTNCSTSKYLSINWVALHKNQKSKNIMRPSRMHRFSETDFIFTCIQSTSKITNTTNETENRQWVRGAKYNFQEMQFIDVGYSISINWFTSLCNGHQSKCVTTATTTIDNSNCR